MCIVIVVLTGLNVQTAVPIETRELLLLRLLPLFRESAHSTQHTQAFSAHDQHKHVLTTVRWLQRGLNTLRTINFHPSKWIGVRVRVGEKYPSSSSIG